MRDKLSLPEALLRLALNDMDQYTLNSKDDEFMQLNYRARGRDSVDSRTSMSHPVHRMSACFLCMSVMYHDITSCSTG